ncbi:MAG: glycosyltransferase [Patescibacteria group bacterium]|nr:glycosyltransferase [Patescibacteria group bacterium]
MNDATKITNVLIVFWNFGIGGIQKKIVDMSHYCKNGRYKNCRFHILLRDKTRFRMDNQLDNSNSKIYYRPQFFNGKLHIPFTLYMIWKIFSLKPTTLLTFLDYTSFLSIIAAKVLFWQKTRIVLNEDILTSPYVDSKIKWYLIPFFYPIADVIISPTHASKDDLVNNFSVPKNKIVVIPNWTLMRIGKLGAKPELDLLYAGRFDKQKNLLFLLNVIKNVKADIPDIKTCFIGDGKQKEEVLQFIKNNHLETNVQIKNGVQNLSPFFRNVKIFAMSSDYEGMPVVLMEAMAAGLCAVVKRCPGSNDYLLNGKTAFIENTISGYAHRVKLLLRNPNLRTKIGKNAQNDVKKYYSEKAISKYLKTLLPNIH